MSYFEQQQLKDVAGAVINPATKENQASQIVLETTLNSLIETIQELSQRIAFLGSLKQHGTEALRIIPVASVSTAVTGPLTDAQNTAANLATLKLSNTYVGDIAVQSNIINVVVT
jgi:hypothetical protein